MSAVEVVVNQDEHHVALPKLIGQPAYARPARPVDIQARPLDPDDLPILAEMTDDERLLAAQLAARGHDGKSNGSGGHHLPAMPHRPIRLRALAGKLLGG
jgi:hypothetical protein